MTRNSWIAIGFLLGTAVGLSGAAQETVDLTRTGALPSALERAGENRGQIQLALDQISAAEREGMDFLIQHMPDRDLQELTAAFLLENVSYAYRAWNEAPWKDVLPKEVFLNDVLPYASITERRDAWRKDFFSRFQPMIAEMNSPGKAAALLNQKIFSDLDVRYSRQRPKADQSPYESMEAKVASCTGLSILLIDACRAVGVPARFVGTPLWSDRSGNHSWVEVWDQGWHFTGAAEPAGDELDRAWFVDRAATAQVDQPRHAIYAVSFRRTPLRFPLVWERSANYVYAVNVTERYLEQGDPPPDGFVRVMFQVLDGQSRERRAANLQIQSVDGNLLQEGTTKDERFDGNDHLVIALPKEQELHVQARFEQQSAAARITAAEDGQTITLVLQDPEVDPSSPAVDSTKPTVDQLKEYLGTSPDSRPALELQPFFRNPLIEADAKLVADLLWQDHAQQVRERRSSEIENRRLEMDGLTMLFDYQVFGQKPDTGRSLFLSMHGGGGAPKQVNDRQWENQKRLYQPAEGVYLSPRAPTDAWNLWHQPHIDRMFDRLIEDLIVLEAVNPNRIYLMGYSAGGDGVYQLAPRMADRLAAASMMAGHPNEASPLGLRNLPFSIHVGANDGAYNRNRVAQEWGDQLAKLRESDPDGYLHWVKIYEGKGHWLDREDAAALAWMTQYARNPRPRTVVWRQDDVTGNRFYWLAVEENQAKAGTEVRASWKEQRLEIQTSGLQRLLVRVDDQMVTMDQPVQVVVNGKEVFHAVVPRTTEVIQKTLAERGDPASVFCGEIELVCEPDSAAAAP